MGLGQTSLSGVVPWLYASLVKNKQNTMLTGKSLSKALIFASTNPQYDDRLYIELQVQYMKAQTWGEHSF